VPVGERLLDLIDADRSGALLDVDQHQEVVYVPMIRR
jgi:hypothetical protein